jgi:hypothetical protein
MRNLEITATTYIDGGVCCLSGRTAAYRTCILRDPDFQWKFTHEFWLGKYLQHSGDDKFLTRWMHSHSWKTFIQACPEAELLSTFKDNYRFLLQLLRWTRNTWRSDLKSIFVERHIWTRHPFVAFTMIDKFFNPFTLLLGPCFVIYLMVKPTTLLPSWVILVSYIVWLFLTRTIKYMPHLARRPQDIIYIPTWIVFNLYFVCLKLYCLATLYVTDWGTRSGADDKNGENDISEIYVPHWDDDDDDDEADDATAEGDDEEIEKSGKPEMTTVSMSNGSRLDFTSSALSNGDFGADFNDSTTLSESQRLPKPQIMHQPLSSMMGNYNDESNLEMDVHDDYLKTLKFI